VFNLDLKLIINDLTIIEFNINDLTISEFD
jgi:hypothetical protein